MIAIIDYDAGNIKSVEKAVQFLGGETLITRDPYMIRSATHVILPGVGAFADAMEKLEFFQLKDVIREVIGNGTPFLGICLGLQLLFEGSDEGENVSGLGVLKGRIVKIPQNATMKVPHMGWNSLEIDSNSRLFQGISNQSYVYFVHSYYLQAEDTDIVAATTEYGVHIHAAVEDKNVFACQFHPEKSSDVGLHILKNFIQLNKEGI